LPPATRRRHPPAPRPRRRPRVRPRDPRPPPSRRRWSRRRRRPPRSPPSPRRAAPQRPSSSAGASSRRLALTVDHLGVDNLAIALGRRAVACAVAAGTRLGLRLSGLRVHLLGHLVVGLLERLRLGLEPRRIL